MKKSWEGRFVVLNRGSNIVGVEMQRLGFTKKTLHCTKVLLK